MKSKILLFLILWLVSDFVKAQVSDLGQEMYQSSEKKLGEMLKSLEKMYGLQFIYESRLVNSVQVSGDIRLTGKAEKVIARLLQGTGLRYEKINESVYVIKKSNTLLSSVNETSLGVAKEVKEILSKNISGKIIDAKTREAMIGVSIVVKSSPDLGTISDVDGHFELSVPDESLVLLCSYIGYQSREVSLADGQSEYLIEMRESVNQLDEVVVTAVGIEANKRGLGYSVSEIKSSDIVNANEANLLSAMSGKTAGVLITQSSGVPGASTSIRIRGNKSINGSNQPLIVVDGMPIDNTSTGNSNAGVDVSNRAIDINPNDVENISVLKGPAATALYGIRAANGAILISTKKGKEGKPTVQIRSSYTLSEVNKLPARQYWYAQGTYLDGKAVYRGPETGEANSFGPRLSDLEYDGDASYLYDKNGRLVPLGTGNGAAANVYRPEEDFFDTGHSYDNNLSVSGGNERVRYYLSAGSLLQQGIVPKSTWSRYSYKGNVDVNVTKKLSFNSNTNIIKSGGDRKNKGNALSGVTIGLYRTPVSFDNGNGLQGRAAANQADTYIFPDGQQRAYRGSDRYDNPYWSVNRVPFTDDVNRFIQSLSARLELIKNLNLSYKIGIDHYSDKRNAAWDIHSGSEVNGRIDLRSITSTDLNSDLLLTYSTRTGKNIKIDATLGHNMFNSNYNSRTTNGFELTKQGFFNISNALNIETGESISRRRLYGVFADLKFGWKNIAYLNLTGRNDWSSTLPRQNNSFFYPTASVGLEFTELLGITDHPILSYGKLRASYGQVGNDPGIFLTENYFNQSVIDGDNLLPANEFPGFGINAFERSTVLGNSNLKAEKTTTFEVGGDFKFFKGKLNLDLTYYKAVTNDLIVEAEVSAASGFTIAPVNAGEILNEGIEMLVGINPVSVAKFNWDVDVNFTKSRNIVTDLPEGISQLSLATFSALSSLIIEGEPYGVLVGTAYKRNEAGQLIIGRDGWPLVNTEQIKLGNPNPDWIMGIRNTFSYGGFTLSGLLDIRHGGDIWNGTKGVMNNLGTGLESGEDRDVANYIYEGVTETGETNTVAVSFADPTKGASAIKWRRNGFLGLAEENIEDGGWVRLRELSLTYLFPDLFFNKWKMSPPSLTVSGRNLWLYTKYSGVDPETNLRGDTNDTGWDYFNMPNTKSVTLSLNLKF